MKRSVIFLLTCILCIQFAGAQVKKGYNLVGGSSTLGLDKDQFSLTLNPNIGWFVDDGFAQGGQVTAFLLDEAGYTYLNVSLMPFIRFYLGKAKTRPFFHGAMGIGFENTWSVSSDGSKEKESDNQLTYELKAGVAYFITDQVSLEGALAFRRYGIMDESVDVGELSIDIGFQIHIFRLFRGGDWEKG